VEEEGDWFYLLLELLVDGIHGIFDGDALEVASGHFETQGEPEVDLLDGWFAEGEFEICGFIDG
jgi:hypothetical protein